METLKGDKESGVKHKARDKDVAKVGNSQESRNPQSTEERDEIDPPESDGKQKTGLADMTNDIEEGAIADNVATPEKIPTPRALMKVDKAVSTNSTLEDLQRALTYEIIFSTLLEKKILAIKRECEERKRAKRMKRKSIGRIFFSRKIFGGTRKPRGDSEPDVFMRGNLGAVLASPTAYRSTKTVKKKTSNGCNVRQIGDEIEVASASTSNGSQRSQFTRPHAKVEPRSNVQGASTADDSLTSTLSNSLDKNGHGLGKAMRRSLLVRAQTHTPAQVMTSSSGSGDSHPLTHKRSMSVTNGKSNENGVITSILDRTYDTTSLASGYDNGTGARLHTSTMADDSLTSLRDSIESLSFASSRCAVSFGGAEIITEDTASLIYERARIAKRLRILEAKSISAQCSPILPRHIINAIVTTESAPRQAKNIVSNKTVGMPVACTAVPYIASSKVTTITTNSVSDIPQVPTSNKITQTKQHIFRHQVSYTDSTYGGVGDFGDASAYSRYISRQNTSEDSANLTISTFLNQSDSLSLHAPIYSPTNSATGDGIGSIGAFMLGDRYKSKSTSLLLVSGNGRTRPPPPLPQKQKQTQILRAPFAAPISGRMPTSNIRNSNQIIDSLNKNNLVSSGIAQPVKTLNAQKQITSLCTTITETSNTAIATNPIPPIHTSLTQPSTFYETPNIIDRNISTAAVIAFNGSRFRNGNVNGVVVGGSAVPEDTAKLNRMTSTSTGSSVAPIGCCTTTKSSSRDRDKDKQRFIPSWPSGQSGSDDEYRRHKRKYKRHHRCSDPVLVYPKPSGLQHCILSMPPNEPIQLQYNDDFVYDMQIQMESDKNDDLEEIVPGSHRRHRKHRHHRHKKRHRHKNPKILVQDLETRVVKVVDPDDLSQRARWTIIVTACLLLIMCLMLVGITLRMAPLIDDMVRQENERLFKETLDRARSIKNATDAASQLAQQQIP